MLIALEQIAAGEGQGAVGNPHELPQPDHRGQQQIGADGMVGSCSSPSALPLSSITMARRQWVMLSGS